MARTSQAEDQIPADGVADVPYPQYATIARSLMANAGEILFKKVTGAGGAGADIVCPFDPAVVLAWHNDGTPSAQALFPSGDAVNLITGADVGAPNISIASRTVTLDSTLLPDAEVANVVVLGFRDVNGSE